MEQLILIAHLLIALAIIGLILLQQGKGAEMGASFGAGASQTLFGSAGGGNVLTRATALLATAFFITSFALAIVARDKADGGSDIELQIPVTEQVEPAMESDLPVMEEDVPTQVVDDTELPEVPEME